MVITLDTINGKLRGAYYTLPDCRVVYLAHKRPSDVLPNGAWAIDDTVLRRCQERGVERVGVVTKKGGRAVYCLTLREDFYGENSYQHFDKAPQRALRIKHFRLHPLNQEATLDRTSTIRR